jgi:hypothetical protein
MREGDQASTGQGSIGPMRASTVATTRSQREDPNWNTCMASSRKRLRAMTQQPARAVQARLHGSEGCQAPCRSVGQP